MSNGQTYKVYATDGFANTELVYDGLSSTSAYEKYEECVSKIGTRYAHVEIVEVLEEAKYGE